jgi:hypothetical protein
MKVLISHRDAARLLLRGERVYGHGTAYQLSCGKRAEESLSEALYMLANTENLFVEMKALPELPDGYRWAGDDPKNPDRIEKAEGLLVSTHCRTAKTKLDRDICAAVVALYDRNDSP